MRNDKVEIVGTLSSSQDSVVVIGGGALPVTRQDMATAQKSLLLSRVKPYNTALEGCCYTINTRYENAAISDYTWGKHCKTCVMYIYEPWI